MNRSDRQTDSNDFQPLQLSHEPSFPNILESVLGVSKTEVRTYRALLRHQNVGVKTLGEELERSVNTVREQLTVLCENQLATRDTRVAKQGRHYTYQATSPAEAKPMLHDVVDYWIAHVSHRIDVFDSDPSGTAIMFRSASFESGWDEDTTESSVSLAKDSHHQILHGVRPSLKDIVTCVFGLSAPVIKLYLSLTEYPRSTAQELAETESLARSTVAGRLNTLQRRGLAYPAGRETGGHMAYEYIPRPLDGVKNAMTTQLEGEWADYAHRRIDEFDRSDLSGVDDRQ